MAQPGGYQQGRGGMVAQPGGYQAAQPGGYQQGRGRGHNTGRGRYGRRRNVGRGRTAFANYIPTGHGNTGGYVGLNAHRPFQSNLVKVHNNWNICYSCGFDVEDGHDLMMCHFDWRKQDHDVHFTRANAQQKLTMGCNACTRGMHKSILPGQA